jgi:hypothetical protein
MPLELVINKHEERLVLAGLGLNERVDITLPPGTRLPHLRCLVAL